ncbi:hypothetical protein [Streptomyces sp. NPDC057794]|uniref:hypothetical protein n=1 Tax=Streptomyces sp. NPDC057794 TaxID=3346251 RepID=UPI0036C27E84
MRAWSKSSSLRRRRGAQAGGFLAVFRAEAVGDTFGLGTARLCPARPAPVTAFLLKPVSEAVHRPGVRVVAFLDTPALPLPGPARASHNELADWLVHSAMAEEDGAESAAGGFGQLSDLLARTDQPDLLNALAAAFSSGVAEAGRRAAEPIGARGPGPYRLWKGTAPTLLHRVLEANAHLPALPPPGEERSANNDGTTLLLVLFKGRHDLADRIVRHLKPRAAVSSYTSSPSRHRGPIGGWPPATRAVSAGSERAEAPTLRSRALSCRVLISPLTAGTTEARTEHVVQYGPRGE